MIVDLIAASTPEWLGALFSSLDVELLTVFLPKIGVALFLGFLLGLERRMRHKQAGVRTHMVLAVTAALATACGQYLFDVTHMGDAARMSQGVLAGVGFVGAGVIMRRGMNSSGVTTAATIFFSIAVGIACGLGLYAVSAATVLLTIGCMMVSHVFLPSREYGGNALRVVCSREKFVEVRKLFGDHAHVDKITKTGSLIEARIHSMLNQNELEKVIATNVFNDDIVALELLDGHVD
ncbi:MAG: MgtC/SapB family protein [Cyanobacteria bacterium]|nr:MgtC/SapB family protein [Cyanobacteriota bacterium]